MAFQFLAAAAGFAEGAAESIENRNKEIQRNAMEEVQNATKQAEAQNEKMRTRRDELRNTADVLSSYGKFTETQIVGLLQKPAVAKVVVDKLKSAKRLDDVDFNKLYEVAQGNTDATIDSTIARMTSVPKQETIAEATPAEPRGAFGLPSSAYRRTIAAGEKAAGMTMAQMRATGRGVPMLTDEEIVKGTINLGQFDDPESITNIQGKLRDNMTKGIGLTDPKNSSLLKQLQNNAIIKDMFEKDKGDEAKPRTAEQIRKINNDSVAVAVNPWIIKNVARRVPETGEVVLIGGTPEDVDAFQKQKTEVIRRNMVALKLIDKDNNITGGRAAFDVLLPIANIEDNKVVSWKKPSEESAKTSQTIREERTTPPPAAPAASAAVQPQRSVLFKDSTVPKDMDPNVWSMMTPEQKALFKPTKAVGGK